MTPIPSRQQPPPGRQESAGETVRRASSGFTFAVWAGIVLLLLRPAEPVTGEPLPAGSRTPAAAGEQAVSGRKDNGIHRQLQLQALQMAFADYIDTLITTDEDIIFVIGRNRIHFQDGKMLGPGHLRWARGYDSIFYLYPLDPLTEPVPWDGERIRIAADFLDALFGRTEALRRTHGRSMSFFDHRIFINDICAGELEAIESELREAAQTDAEVARWIAELDVVYSFQTRSISDTGISSYHAYGLAIDLEPRSYGRRQVFWEWTRVWYRNWHRIPLDQRWSPPQAVIETFEKHGFVWGGKWARFDTIHFEYRPEIILFNRLLADRDLPIYR